MGDPDPESAGDHSAMVFEVVPEKRRPGRPPKDKNPGNKKMKTTHTDSNSEALPHGSQGDSLIASVNKQSTSTSQQPDTELDASTHTTTHSSNNSTHIKSNSINKFKNLIYFDTINNISRVDVANIWEEMAPNSNDVIIKTTNNFILKSNTDLNDLKNIFNSLIDKKHISKYTVASPSSNIQSVNINNKTINSSVSFSAVIASLEAEIHEDEIANYLKNNNLTFRYCKRIISRATGKPTMMVRLITHCTKSFERVLSDGIFFKYRHYRAFPSKSPPPISIPCAKCGLFVHTTDKCQAAVKCNKCDGNHSTSKCTSPLPIKCAACGANDHSAWSTKCPKHPKEPVPGLPLSKIRPVNKKSFEMPSNVTSQSRIHAPITTHDLIVNTYIKELNNPIHFNRDEILSKLKRRFIESFKIDTTAVFSGNYVYIFMFDLLDPSAISPTEPNNVGSQVIIRNDGA